MDAPSIYQCHAHDRQNSADDGGQQVAQKSQRGGAHSVVAEQNCDHNVPHTTRTSSTTQ